MRLVGIVAGYAFMALSVLIVVEILSRKLLNYSVQGVDEIGGYVVAVAGTFGMALAASQCAHTRIDVALNKLPAVIQAALNVLAYVTLSLSALFIAYMAWLTLSDSLAFNSRTTSPLQTPLWIPQSLWLAGLILFALTAGVMAGRALFVWRQGVQATNRLLGPATIDEEIEEASR